MEKGSGGVRGRPRGRRGDPSPKRDAIRSRQFAWPEGAPRWTFAGRGRRVPGCPFLAPGRFRRVGAAGFSFTGIMPEGVGGVAEGLGRLDSSFARRTFCSAMRLAKANSMRVTASRPRKASCLACAVIQLAAQRRRQKRINFRARRLPCHALELPENDPGRKLPIFALPRRVDCRRLKSYDD